MKPEVLVVCGDAGGAAAVAPVIERLQREERVDLRLAPYLHAAEVWARRGLVHQKLPAHLDDTELLDLSAGADALLLGTSVNGVDYERRLGGLCPERSVAVLDFWSNYAPRFRSEGGILVQPTWICVMDEQARDGMTTEGFDATRLVVTGQPAFDALARMKAGFSVDERNAIRSTFGVREGGLLVLFASQPLAEFYAQPALRGRHPDFDQYAALRLLIDQLEIIAPELGRQVVLLVRPHPREDPQSLAWVASRCGRVDIHLDAAGESHAAALAADLVCGMTSMLLVEAHHLGCPVLSIRPGLSGPDLLPANRAGWSRLARNAGELGAALRHWLTAGSARAEPALHPAACLPDGQASRRVAEVLYSVLRKRRQNSEIRRQ